MLHSNIEILLSALGKVIPVRMLDDALFKSCGYEAETVRFTCVVGVPTHITVAEKS